MKRSRKRHLFPVCALLLLAMAPAALRADDAENEIRKKLLEEIVMDLSPMRGEALDQVLRTTVWELEVTLLPDEDQGGRARANQTDRIFLADGTLRRIVSPSTNMPLPYFMDLIDPEFQLTEETAPVFKQMLQSLMHRRFFDDIEPDIVRIDDETWHFYTGTFFDDLKAFVVSVNEEGNVTAVHYNLRLEDNR
ncbi:MAG: hypothetical protein JJU29_13990 [Verrucomicrobia bacterium]|nr:hypothetical protein [Verrucomicrobiota bacterium]MCH8512203.1 hypothetical protein [Kiritimatiellia bacterium]